MVDEDNPLDWPCGTNPMYLYLVSIRHHQVLLTGVAMLGYQLEGGLVGGDGGGGEEARGGGAT